MKKLLYLAAVLIGLNASIATADHKATTEYDGLGWSNLPTICGSTLAKTSLNFALNFLDLINTTLNIYQFL